MGILLVILLCSAITNGALLPSKSLSLEETQLIRCLTYISHRYFATERSLVISSPSAYRDVQQELIAEIHRTSIWPVVVSVDGNISKPNKTGFIDIDGSYIILIPDGNIERFVAEFNGRALDVKFKFKSLWNSEARFVVAAANQFSMSQQTKIFNFFSKFGIYNCIIVSQDYYVVDKEHSRPINVTDVDTGMKLGLYTWFPYQSPDRCTEVNDITILDSWVISAQGHFTKNTDLFPEKISKSLSGCPMKAVVRNSYWGFTTYYNVTDSNGTVVTNVLGMEMDLFMLVLKQMNMTFVHVPTPEGFQARTGRTDNLIKAMVAKEAYIALGNVGTDILLHPLLDSTNSHYMMSIRFYVPCSV